MSVIRWLLRHTILAILATLVVLSLREYRATERERAERAEAAEARRVAVAIELALAAERVSPVVGEFVLSGWRFTRSGAVARATGEKLRDCIFVDMRFANLTTGHDGHVEFVDDDTPGSSRIVGRHNFGLFLFGNADMGDRIRIATDHICTVTHVYLSDGTIAPIGLAVTDRLPDGTTVPAASVDLPVNTVLGVFEVGREEVEP